MAQIPIKTQILTNIKSAIQTIPDFVQVYLNPERGLRESDDKPYCNIFVQPEKAPIKRSLWREGEFDVLINVWYKADTSDILDTQLQYFNAAIQAVLLPTFSPARQMTIYFEEAASDFDSLFFGDSLGVAVSNYTVKYRHVYGNPFQLNP